VTTTAAIFGCAGPALTPEEAAFFRDVRPWGFILFGRNVESPDQLRRLCEALRETVGREEAPILVDQEGGRVQRLGPPHWPRYPASRSYGALPADLQSRSELVGLGARLMAHDLTAVGITVDCLPVLDAPAPDASEVVGDRAYSAEPDEVAALGRAAAEGLLAGGILPVIKHMPGHGRARADSHHELPVVGASREELAGRDFAPFRALADLPIGMSAHVVYAAFDGERPGTLSSAVVQQAIRGEIGFQGLLLTDDLSMQALSGPLSERARLAREAGCDVVLHGNGDMLEMSEVARGAGFLQGAAAVRAREALSRRQAADPFDVEGARERLAAAFEGRLAA